MLNNRSKWSIPEGRIQTFWTAPFLYENGGGLNDYLCASTQFASFTNLF